MREYFEKMHAKYGPCISSKGNHGVAEASFQGAAYAAPHILPILPILFQTILLSSNQPPISTKSKGYRGGA
jgi:hypothetical protein